MWDATAVSMITIVSMSAIIQQASVFKSSWQGRNVRLRYYDVGIGTLHTMGIRRIQCRSCFDGVSFKVNFLKEFLFFTQAVRVRFPVGNQILPVNFNQNVTGWCFNLRGAKGDCSHFINLVLYNFVLRFAILSMKEDFCRILRVSTSSSFSYLFLFFTNSYAFGFYFILRLSPLKKIS